MPGPVPKRSEERRRRNKPAVETMKVNLDEVLAGEVEIPEPDPEWHPVAALFYESLAKSGQAIWLEPSDWAAAYLLAESISRDLDPQVVGVTETGEVIKDTIPLKGASLSAYLKGFSSLLVLEGDRRRLQIELERAKRLDAAASGENAVVDLAQRRKDALG